MSRRNSPKMKAERRAERLKHRMIQDAIHDARGGAMLIAFMAGHLHHPNQRPILNRRKLVLR